MYRAYGTRNPRGLQRIEIRCDNINRADGSTFNAKGVVASTD
jgi:hypothetical protein